MSVASVVKNAFAGTIGGTILCDPHSNVSRLDGAISEAQDGALTSKLLLDVKADRTGASNSEYGSALSDSERELMVLTMHLPPLTATFVRARDEDATAAHEIATYARQGLDGVHFLLDTLVKAVPPPSTTEVDSNTLEYLCNLTECAFALAVSTAEEIPNPEKVLDVAWKALDALKETFGRAPPRQIVTLLTALLCVVDGANHALRSALLAPPFAGSPTDWYLMYLLPVLVQDGGAPNDPQMFNKAVIALRDSTVPADCSIIRELGKPVQSIVEQIFANVLLAFTGSGQEEFWALYDNKQLESLCSALVCFRHHWTEVHEGWTHLHHLLQSRLDEDQTIVFGPYAALLASLPVDLDALTAVMEEDLRQHFPNKNLVTNTITHGMHSDKSHFGNGVALLEALCDITAASPATLEAVLDMSIVSFVTTIVTAAIRSSNHAAMNSARNILVKYPQYILSSDVLGCAAGTPNTCSAPQYEMVTLLLRDEDRSIGMNLHDMLCNAPPATDIPSFVHWLSACQTIATVDTIHITDTSSLHLAVAQVFQFLDVVVHNVQRQCLKMGGFRLDLIVSSLLSYIQLVSMNHAELVISGITREKGPSVLLRLLELLFSATRLATVEKAASIITHCMERCPNGGFHVVRVSTMTDKRLSFTKHMQQRLARGAHSQINVCRLKALESVATFDPDLYHFISVPHTATKANLNLQHDIVKEIVENEGSDDLERAAGLSLLACVQDTSIDPSKIPSLLPVCKNLRPTPAAECMVAVAALRYVCQYATTKRAFPHAVCLSDGKNDGIIADIAQYIAALEQRIITLSERLEHKPVDLESISRKPNPCLHGDDFAYEGGGSTINNLVSALEACFQASRSLEAYFLIAHHYVSLKDDGNARSSVSAGVGVLQTAVKALISLSGACHQNLPLIAHVKRATFKQALAAAGVGALVVRCGSTLQLNSFSASEAKGYVNLLRLLEHHYAGDLECVVAVLRTLTNNVPRHAPDEIQGMVCESLANAIKTHQGDKMWEVGLECCERFAKYASMPVAIKLLSLCWERCTAALKDLNPTGTVELENKIIDESLQMMSSVLGQVSAADQHVSPELLNIVTAIGGKYTESYVRVDGYIKRQAWHAVWCSLLGLLSNLLTFGHNRWTNGVVDWVRTCPRFQFVLEHPIRQDAQGCIYPYDLVETSHCLTIVAICHAQRCPIPAYIPQMRRGFSTLFNYRIDRIKHGIANTNMAVSVFESTALPPSVEFLCVPMARNYMATFLAYPPTDSGTPPIIELADKGDITFDSVRDFVMQQLGVLSRLQHREMKGSDDSVEKTPSLRMSIERDSFFGESEAEGHMESKDHHIMALQGALILYVECASYYAAQPLTHKQHTMLLDAKEQLVATMNRVSKVTASTSEVSITAFLMSIKDQLEAI